MGHPQGRDALETLEARAQGLADTAAMRRATARDGASLAHAAQLEALAARYASEARQELATLETAPPERPDPAFLAEALLAQALLDRFGRALACIVGLGAPSADFDVEVYDRDPEIRWRGRRGAVNGHEGDPWAYRHGNLRAALDEVRAIQRELPRLTHPEIADTRSGLAEVTDKALQTGEWQAGVAARHVLEALERTASRRRWFGVLRVFAVGTIVFGILAFYPTPLRWRRPRTWDRIVKDARG